MPPFKDVPEAEVNITLDRIAELMSDPDEEWDELEEHYARLDFSKISTP